MSVKLTRFNIQDYIKTPQDQKEFLEANLEDGTPDEIISAIGEIARARGATKFARASGVSRETLYKQFRHGGNPRLNTITKTMSAPGLSARLGGRAKTAK